ncbi:MAG: AAA family ATPase [Candidatus Micrarchaeaceae archaeon]
MANLLVVFGTQGAGKSHVLAGISGIAKIVNMGDEMLKMAEQEYGINDRDKMRTIPAYAEKSQEWRVKIFSQIEATDGTVLLDTHASIKSADRYTPGLTMRDLDAMKGFVKGIIYIDATTEEVLSRRANDNTRNREHDTAEGIDQHRSINLSLASFFSAYLNIPLYIIHNKEGSLNEAQERLKGILQELNM